MLATTPTLATKYDYLSDRFRAAYAFLGRDDLATLEPGRYDIDGEKVFAKVMDVTTVPAESKDYEAHRRYFDVQYVVSGMEAFLVAPVCGLAVTKPYDEEGDFALYAGPDMATTVILAPGDLVAVSPEEAHKPACCVSGPVAERKVVVKVAVD